LLFHVDFEKTYDIVDWKYLENVKVKMNFPTLWQKWMMECVTTVTTSILVNVSPIEEFELERGLRQGDLLSPFLLLISAKGLNILMNAPVDSSFSMVIELVLKMRYQFLTYNLRMVPCWWGKKVRIMLKL